MRTSTLKKAAKIGAGAFLFSLAVSAALGYYAAKKSESEGLDLDEEFEGDRKAARTRAFREMLDAGEELKGAMQRLSRSVKTIAKGEEVEDDSESEEDEDTEK